jgi:hypothetical protein
MEDALSDEIEESARQSIIRRTDDSEIKPQEAEESGRHSIKRRTDDSEVQPDEGEESARPSVIRKSEVYAPPQEEIVEEQSEEYSPPSQEQEPEIQDAPENLIEDDELLSVSRLPSRLTSVRKGHADVQVEALNLGGDDKIPL